MAAQRYNPDADLDSRIGESNARTSGISGERPLPGGAPASRASQHESASSRHGAIKESILDRIGYHEEDDVGGRKGSDRTEAAHGSGTAPESGGSEVPTIPSPPPSWSSDDWASPSQPFQRDTFHDRAGTSRGYYSRRQPGIESVTIPGPPQAPNVQEELDRLQEGPNPTEVRRRTEIPGQTVAKQIFIPAPLRSSARHWLRTGSLQLSENVSPRHARALQRALLLSLLLEQGWEGLPGGLQRRAAWLFRVGWAKGEREVDANDLCFVLGLPTDDASREALCQSAWARIPEDAFPPPSSSGASVPRRPPSGAD